MNHEEARNLHEEARGLLEAVGAAWHGCYECDPVADAALSAVGRFIDLLIIRGME